jgi:NADPH:quinone reductase-like Zn-dependent oxidoreductase
VRATRFSSQVSTELLNTFARLIDEGQVKVTIGATFPLHEAAKAQELSQKGHGRGRIVLHIV